MVKDLSGNNPDPIATSPSTEQHSSGAFFGITPSDTADLQRLTRGIYVGSDAGNVVAMGVDGNTETFTGVPLGTILPICAKRILATGTTSTGLVGLA